MNNSYIQVIDSKAHKKNSISLWLPNGTVQYILEFVMKIQLKC